MHILRCCQAWLQAARASQAPAPGVAGAVLEQRGQQGRTWAGDEAEADHGRQAVPPAHVAAQRSRGMAAAAGVSNPQDTPFGTAVHMENGNPLGSTAHTCRGFGSATVPPL